MPLVCNQDYGSHAKKKKTIFFSNLPSTLRGANLTQWITMHVDHVNS